MIENNIVIELRDIYKVFKVKSQDVKVLKDISLDIYAGDFLILFGPSGCGKSTLLHTILGLEAPSSGTVKFLGSEIYKLSEDDRAEFRKKHVGMIYQQPNWIKSLNVIENVVFACSLLGIDKETSLKKAKSYLELVGMLDWADYYPTELSSGQQQKISLARALVTDPRIIIADEPTGNLDYQSGMDLMKLFKKLSEEGRTVVMVTHDVNNIYLGTKLVQIFDGFLIKIHDLTKVKDKEKFKQEIVNRNVVIPVKSELKIKIYEPEIKKKKNLSDKIRGFKVKAGQFFPSLVQTLSFTALLIVYLGQKFISKIEGFFRKIFGRSINVNNLPNKIYFRLVKFFDRSEIGNISRIDLINLSIKNMLIKKNRSLITVGGMAIGIGAIVFLVSIGYGLEKLVVSRVARLEEIKQVDVAPAVASNIKLSDKSLESFKEIVNVTQVLPIIGVVGKVNYKNSNTDIAVYGVLSDYLKESAIKTSSGKIFTSNNLYQENESYLPSEGQVAGVSTSIEEENASTSVNFKVDPERFIRVRAEAKTGAEIIGYTRRVEGLQTAEEYQGESYQTNEGNSSKKWLKATVLLWQMEKCTVEENPECENNNFVPMRDSGGSQVQKEGCFAELNLVVSQNLGYGQVLGVSTESTASTSANDLIDLAVLEATASAEKVKEVTINESSSKEAVVNKSFLQVLGIDENKAVGETFSASLVAVGSLVDGGEKVVSTPADYIITGVIADTSAPLIYLPILNLKQMGINYYSQMKLVVTNQGDVAGVRKKIEALGYKTTSVVDTVSQINSLFASIRTALALLGAVALSVAALGMFNTLTVSLLERTREVGMMKTMGMKSVEVKKLFLTESMIMGIFGGIGGLFLGFVLGQILSFVLSLFSIFKGAGYINLSYIPPLFTILILTLSLLVGFVTGIYPSKRATKISALNALRYE
ncbi:MAG: ATP-binding cassette domain-containing protein [Candidatus Shapirobacteria bacterium]|jgi:putative ABC transport system ATP-binding protein